MLIEVADFNNSSKLIEGKFGKEWNELKSVLLDMPLHIKESDQAGIQGSPIFDPVGTNEYIQSGLLKIKWVSKFSIPEKYRFLGADVDFCKNGLLVEIQFSNYPFLLNNTIRSELFFKAKLPLAGFPTEATIIVTKAHMYPASNSTLYYEQAKNQLTELAANHVFDSPIRLVGLFGPVDEEIEIVFSQYSTSRYSRTVKLREKKICLVKPGRSSQSRCNLVIRK